MSAKLERGERIRAKFYCAKNDGTWEDPQFEGQTLTVSVRGEQLILRASEKVEVEIDRAETYKQSGQHVRWHEEDETTQDDVALSFVNEDIAAEFAAVASTSASLSSLPAVWMDPESGVLPEPSAETLTTALETVARAKSDAEKEEVAKAADIWYLINMTKVFETAERGGDMRVLDQLFNLTKALIGLCVATLCGRLCDDQVWLGVLGMLEHDLQIPKHQRQAHRKFFQKKVDFHDLPVTTNSPDALRKAHRAFRLGYLRDCCIARHFDDVLMAQLNGLVNRAQGAVVEELVDPQAMFLDVAVRSMATDGVALATIAEALQHVRVPHGSPATRERLVTTLVEKGVYGQLEVVLEKPPSPSPGVADPHALAVDILARCVEVNPERAQAHVAKKSRLLSTLITMLRSGNLPQIEAAAEVVMAITLSPDVMKVWCKELFLPTLLRSLSLPIPRAIDAGTVVGLQKQHIVNLLIHHVTSPPNVRSFIFPVLRNGVESLLAAFASGRTYVVGCVICLMTKLLEAGPNQDEVFAAAEVLHRLLPAMLAAEEEDKTGLVRLRGDGSWIAAAAAGFRAALEADNPKPNTGLVRQALESLQKKQEAVAAKKARNEPKPPPQPASLGGGLGLLGEYDDD
jgi:hypothetical protein